MSELGAVGARVLIYGSCVSRDAFELSEAPPLADYVARSALGSAFSPVPSEPPAGLDLAANPSPFQRRMVQLDIEKGLPGVLGATPHDVLLLDLIDERLELVRTGESWITDSPEARTCGLDSLPEDRVRVGTDEYFALFEAGLARLVELVPPHRIVLNRVLWATHTTAGDELPHPDYIRRHNVALEAAYKRIDTTGIRSIDYEPGLFVTDPTHKWGASPFHYGAALYVETLRALHELVG
ncbi:DUF6270 domain-containing protein [Terrabacter sp. GCM10028922]|uniref:DUF6270 domain-containing protein n=1 Tax=Terrabacter sp. GCM10028922 TaxID=3273428 RepID=UPI00360F45B6